MSSKSSSSRDPQRWNVTKDELLGEGAGEDGAGGSQAIPWAEMTSMERVEHVAFILFKVGLLLFVIFTFICTLALLADAFKLIGGRGIGEAVKNSRLIQNPVSASIIGMVVTLILQSSSTLISILVGMVAGGIITVHQAIPVMMGAEIGASFFNALISLGQSGNRDQFRRAFAAATMNDIFNFLCYLVILPLELATGIIEKLSAIFVGPLSGAQGKRFDTLNVITDPILHKIVQLDEDAISNAALADQNASSASSSANQSFVYRCMDYGGPNCPYDHLFANSSWSDMWIGICLLAISILLLVLCLIGVVRLLNSLLAGQVAFWVRRIIDKQLPRPFGWLTNYLVMVFGCFVVMIVQSSGVFRSALIPLAGLGVVPLERFYPLLLGANVGTTFTGVLAALSADPMRLNKTMQIALCQTVYNLLSILFFYPVPFMRRIPITLAMRFGDLTAKYRWFALVYIGLVFFLIPASLLLLSFLPSPLMLAVVAFIVAIIGFIVLVSILQGRCPSALPVRLRSWQFLPRHMRSLQPYDRFMSKLFASLPFLHLTGASEGNGSSSNSSSVNGHRNGGFLAAEHKSRMMIGNGAAAEDEPASKNVQIRFFSSPKVQPRGGLQNQTHFPPTPLIRMPSASVQTDV